MSEKLPWYEIVIKMQRPSCFFVLTTGVVGLAWAGNVAAIAAIVSAFGLLAGAIWGERSTRKGVELAEKKKEA